MEKIQFENLLNCVRLINDEIEIVVTTDVGPRIMYYGSLEGENVVGVHLEAKVEPTLGEFKPYGGHCLGLVGEHIAS